MSIEEIMKPYFDKKEEFSKRKENFEAGYDLFINVYKDEVEKCKLENEEYEREMLALKTRLQTLRNNRNSEIEEYVKNAVSERPDFYAGYGAMIRKDLEQEYLKREKALELQIIGLSDKINNNYLKIAKNNKSIRESEEAKKSGEANKFHNVDIRELTDIKHDVRKSLIAARKELELKLKETQLRFDAVMHKLTVFKHEYNENHVATNGNEYRGLFEESNHLIEVKYNLQRELDKLDENLKITELTEEEIKVIMMSMTDSEKKEYEKRKKMDSIISTVEQVTNEEVEEKNDEPQEKIVVPFEFEEKENESIIYEIARKGIEEQNRIEENYSEFIKEISRDVLSSVNKLRGVKVTDGKYLSISAPDKETEELEFEDETTQIANGLYLNKRDVFKALNNYVRKNKGQSFIVKGINETLTVTRQSLKEVKRFLKECTVKKLFSEKKLSAFDIKRVFGKKKAEKYIGETNKKAKMPTGDYILRTDIHEALKLLFVEKTPTWLETLKSKFVRKNEEIGLGETLDAEYSQVESNELEQENIKVK